jgi:beta-catenin-like protein 1
MNFAHLVLPFSLPTQQAKKGKSAQPAQEDNAHVLNIIGSLFTSLESDTPLRTRLLAKFVESGYEKIDRMLELREHAEARLAVTEREIAGERRDLEIAKQEVDETMEDVWDLRRLDGGQFTLQSIDYILAWISMEDDGVRTLADTDFVDGTYPLLQIRGHLQQLLSRKNKTLQAIANTLKKYLENISSPAGEDSSSQQPNVLELILTQLIAYLEAC